MKRDYDRIRELLLKFEGAESQLFRLDGDEFNAFDQYQIDLMAQAGFIRFEEPESVRRMLGGFHPAGVPLPVFFSISWAGHEYLDTIRDPEIWRKTKAGSKKIGGATLGIMKDLAVAYIKHEAKEKLGIALG